MSTEQKLKIMKDRKEGENKFEDRLSKRLCYILRYGALKEGLPVYQHGFVDVKDVMTVGFMRYHTEEEVLAEVSTSLGHRKTKRFERKDINGKTLIRAAFCRNFEPNPCHEGTNIPTLLQTSIDFVLDNLQEYDLEDFQDEHLIRRMILQLKRKKKLNTKNLKTLLVPVLEHLDLSSDVYITQGILKAMWTNCPNLRVLNLKNCGYIITDNILEMLFRKLPYLETVNLSECKHITDKGLAAIVKHGKNLQNLNLCWIRGLSGNAILDIVVNCEKLKLLDIYDLQLAGEERQLMIEAARQRGIKIGLKGLLESDPDVTFENPSLMLDEFVKTG